MRSGTTPGLGMLLLAGMVHAAHAEPDIGPAQREHQVSYQGADPVYPADFFAPFQPQTALDMLDHTPGFVLSEGDFVRGFGAAAGNVLIDGQRPTVKAGGIAEVLQRIPALRVERILLLRGGEAAEAQGQMLVANVILKSDAGGSGTVALDLMRTFDGNIGASGRISHARRIGDWQTGIEVSGELIHFPNEGHYRLRDQAGALVESRSERIAGKSPEAGLAISASRALAGGTFTSNVRLGYDAYSARQTIVLHPGDFDAPPAEREDLAHDDEAYLAEAGVDWTRGLRGDWMAKLVGLGRVERFRTDEDFTGPEYRGVSALRQRPTEAIGRMTLSREGGHRLRPEIGVEVAWNALTSHLDYAEDLGTGLMAIGLDGADVRVTELRGEGFANLGARLSSDFSAEAGMAFERSRIRAKSDGSNTRSLSYLKPSAALIWSRTGATEARLGIRRSIDQLDFGDFAASVDQVDGRPLGGNAELRPARLTRAYLRLDRRWGEGGALSAELFGQRHDGLLGYILLPSGDQARGAIGDGRELGLTAQATFPLATIVPHAQLRFDGTLRRSRVEDALSGRTRRIDDLPDSTLSAEFRQELPALGSAWGLRYAAPQSARIHFIGEEYSWRDLPVWTAYIETSVIAGFKTVLTVEGIAGRDYDRFRRFHDPNDPDILTGTETRRQSEGTVISLSLTRSL